MNEPNPADPAREGADSEPEKRVLQFATPEEWFTQYFAPHIRRKLGGSYTWCAEWWRHAEAISRIYALWMAWEHLRGEGPLGPSTWWLHHADPHLSVLMSRDNGPFAGCRPDRHNPPEPLPFKIAPSAVWRSSAFQDPR
ncbi:DUF4913 domain-containing protein [Actinomadura rayongensis]|uniref:DUF4913 domain-containing protein n=1 Tax=Actinomadura rayongensis TaxID=1429076 RepID=A0A6I4WFC6_9ACTN|nr:DUF4913 domain-containing protein [Actinomadura rayongensis]MXQ65634.1 DUF4913 domain-containing protein [Actinomadura rayongensis]